MIARRRPTVDSLGINGPIPTLTIIRSAMPSKSGFCFCRRAGPKDSWLRPLISAFGSIIKVQFLSYNPSTLFIATDHTYPLQEGIFQLPLNLRIKKRWRNECEHVTSRLFIEHMGTGFSASHDRHFGHVPCQCDRRCLSTFGQDGELRLRAFANYQKAMLDWASVIDLPSGACFPTCHHRQEWIFSNFAYAPEASICIARRCARVA